MFGSYSILNIYNMCVEGTEKKFFFTGIGTTRIENTLREFTTIEIKKRMVDIKERTGSLL